jgi:hypothetical protein
LGGHIRILKLPAPMQNSHSFDIVKAQHLAAEILWARLQTAILVPKFSFPATM